MEGISSGASTAFAGAQKVYKFTSDEQFRNEVIVNTVALMVLMNAAYCIYQYRLMQSFVMLTASTTFLMYRDAFVQATIRATAESLQTTNKSLIDLAQQQSEQLKDLKANVEQFAKGNKDLTSKIDALEATKQLIEDTAKATQSSFNEYMAQEFARLANERKQLEADQENFRKESQKV